MSYFYYFIFKTFISFSQCSGILEFRFDMQNSHSRDSRTAEWFVVQGGVVQGGEEWLRWVVRLADGRGRVSLLAFRTHPS